MAIIEDAARGRTKLDDAASNHLDRAISALLASQPRPTIPLRAVHALVAVDLDAAQKLTPLVPPSQVVAELQAVLAGGGAGWGPRFETELWIVRFAEIAAIDDALDRGTVDRLLASVSPLLRRGALQIAAGYDLLDRARLREYIRDDDPEMRTIAFNSFVQTTPPGDEAAALEEVRAWLNSDRDDPSEAAYMLPGLGPGGAAIAEEVVRRGGLSDSDLAPAFASLILNRRLDAVPLDATQGELGGALVGWLEGARSTDEGAGTAITAFLRRASVPTDETLMDRWFELAVDSGDSRWLEDVARDRSQRPAARAHALDRYIEQLQADGSPGLPVCVLEFVKDRRDDPAFRRMVLADVLDTSQDRALACDLDLLAAVRDIAATEKNPHVRRAARDALESAERSLSSNK